MKPKFLASAKRAVFVLTFALCLPFIAPIIETRIANAQKVPEAGNITGRVFQDYNGNGNFDITSTITNNGFGTTAVAIDSGIANVQVRAYNAAGTNVTPGGVVLTNAGGQFTLATNDVGIGPYRVEFTALPAGYLPSARSTDSVNGGSATNSGSTVQFVSTPATNVNLAVNYPADYSQNNPEVAAMVFVSGDQLTGTNNSLNVLQSFPYSAGSTDTATGANPLLFDEPFPNQLSVAANQVGSAFGLAYSRTTRRLFTASYFKRHVGFGPQGPGAIYVVDRAGIGSVVNFFTVPNATTNSHQTANYPRDNGNAGWDAVGTTSLGGMAISEDDSTLFVMNLQNRTLYSINASSGAVNTSQAAPTNLPLPAGTCPAADARPFAVTVYRGLLYVGLVCSAQSSANVDSFTDSIVNGIHDSGDYFIDANQDGTRQGTESFFNLTGGAGYDAGEAFVDGDGNGVYNLGDARNLRAYVYTVNPSTLAFSASPVFQMPLNYRRGLTTHSQSANAAWRPWSNIYRNAQGANRVTYAQPMLTDIAFDNGNLILGLRDRAGDQVGNGSLSNPGDPSNTTFYQPRTAGDVIRACGALNAWTVESNGRCGGTGAAPQNVAEGPSGGEFYFGDAYDLAGDFITPAVTVTGKGGNHDDTGSGGVEQLPGAPDVMITNFDAIPNVPGQTHDGGIRWLSNTTGAFTKGFRLYDANGDDPDTLGKAGGVGSSMALMPDPAPIEIGNRVWRDTNFNGVQDPGENPIAGVTVRLYQGSTLVGTAVTDANGEYYFVGSTVPDGNTNDNIGQVNGGILRNTTYQVRFDNPLNYVIGQPLFGLIPTVENQTSQLGDDDSSDSDATRVTNPPGSPAGTFPVISLTTGGVGANNHTFDVGFILSPSAANVSLIGRIMTAEGRGIRNVQVYLLEQDGTQHSALSSSFGYYRFDDIEAGQSVVVSVSAKRFEFPNPVRLITLDDNIEGFDFIANGSSVSKSLK
ncbi:MAG: SdrD B-like domain-containing protein [Pyrinomonadaceae bacterium]